MLNKNMEQDDDSLEQVEAAVKDTLVALVNAAVAANESKPKPDTKPNESLTMDSLPVTRSPRLRSNSGTPRQYYVPLVNGDGSRLPTPFDPVPVNNHPKRWSVAIPNGNELKYKLDTMQHQLQTLQLKNQEILGKYQNVLRELESALERERHLDATVDELKADNYRVRSEKEMIAQEKQLLQQQLLDLRVKLEYKSEELNDLKERLRSPPISVSAMENPSWAENLLKQWEDVRQDNELLRQECDLLRDQHHLERDRNNELHNQLELEIRERRTEQDKHRSELIAAYQQMHKSAQDRDLLRSQYESAVQQLEECRAELQVERTRFHSQRQHMDDQIQQFHRKYEIVSAEYKQVMGERGQVLKEINDLTDEKDRLEQQVRKLESDRNAMTEQLNTVRTQLQQIQIEKANIQNKFDEVRQAEQISISSESEVADITRNALEKEATELRQKLESTAREMEANRDEISEAHSRRDWALAERQRILSERESMRTMCDQLRRERDEAITKLANAIRDSDDLQRQREKAERELKEIKDKFELDLQIRDGISISPSHSRDSAIDTDLAEWDVETVEVNMNGVQNDVGIELRGGRDDPVLGTNVPIYVKNVTKGSKLDGLLRVFDCIMQLNDIDVGNMEHRSVMDILKNSKNVKMVVKRRRLIGMRLISVPVNAADSAGDLGLLFEDGVYISKIKTSSPAAKAGNLAVGDRIIYINDIPVQGKSSTEINELSRNVAPSGIVFAVMKCPPVLSPLTPTVSFPHGFSMVRPSASTLTGGFKKVTDQGVQTISFSSVDLSQNSNMGSPQKSKGNLLDKVHDKIFGKNEKKQRSVVASASISGPETETLMKRPISGSLRQQSQPFSSSTISPSCQTPAKCWAFSSDRRNTKTNSFSSNAIRGLSPEEQVIERLDDILNEADIPAKLNNKNLTKAVTAEKESGSTWPKYRENSVSEDVGSTINPRMKKGPVRPSVFNQFPVFPPPSGANNNSPTITAQPTASSSVQIRKKNVPYLDPKGSASHPVSPAHSLHQEPRPTSYHPALSSPRVGKVPLSFVGQQQPIYEHSAKYARPMSSTGAYRIVTKSPPNYEDPDDYPPPPSHGLPATFVTEKTYQVARAYRVPVQSVPPASPSLPPPPYPGAAQSFLHGDPDTQSITSQSSSSIQTSSRGTPTKHGVSKFAPPYFCRSSPFQPFSSSTDQLRISQGDVRKICIERGNSCEYLGISVDSRGNGVFISCVSENSLAARNGVQVGDQLLDVCGVNFRNVDLHTAKKVLRTLGRNEQITMTVQYNPQRFHEQMMRSREFDVSVSSANSTPRATPVLFAGQNGHMQRSLLSRESSVQSSGALSREVLGAISENEFTPEQPRFAFLTKKDPHSCDWGFTIIGGNAVGIFVDEITKDGPADGSQGLKPADQILEFNGINFRTLTLEQAHYELQRKSEDGTVLAQQNEHKFQKCKRGLGDSFYVRVNVDRPAENTDELPLKTGDILYVDNTVFMGKPGRWRAWRLDQEGRERSCGIIPSRYKLEEELLLKRSGSEISTGDGSSEGGGSRRGTIRRSLKFIRRSSRSSQHQRTPSKESTKDHDSADPFNFLDDLYQRVERLDYKRKRPVLIVGAIVEPFVSKLVEEYPHMFAHCVPECVKISHSELEQKMKNAIFVDYRKRDKLFEVTRVAAVKEIVDQGFHCILDVSVAALERLQRLQIYPVVIVVKCKSSKQVKELCEWGGDRVGSKIAKEMMERAAHTEQEVTKINFQYCTVSATPQPCAEHTIRLVCQQIVSAVEHEQKKTLWILSSETL